MTLSTLGDDGVAEPRYLSGLSFVHSGRAAYYRPSVLRCTLSL